MKNKNIRQEQVVEVKREPTVEEELLEAMAEFTDALRDGEVTKRLTCRQIKLNLQPQDYSPPLVKKTRMVLGISQVLFARFLGVSPKTVRSWEQGKSTPGPMACRFMDEIRLAPNYWIERFRNVIVTKDDCEGVTL
jgi:putative transcriptional regulator